MSVIVEESSSCFVIMIFNIDRDPFSTRFALDVYFTLVIVQNIIELDFTLAYKYGEFDS